METLAHFPASPYSKYCKKDKPDMICDKVDWSVKAGLGQFVVKVSIGDPTINSKVDLSINDETVISAIIPKGKLREITKIVDSKNGFITLSSFCRSNCDYSMAKINAIEIVPFIKLPTSSKLEDLNVNNKELCGGSFENGNKLIINNL